ncbi:MAG TPA: hypothetical protein VE078_03205 [Thermoanaerobaculia bacterium]|nr:hypothetical protein [Thermoanaerobaculia bacterium]
MEDHALTPHDAEVTIPNVRLDLEELLAVIQGLDEPSRARVAKALVAMELKTRFKDLIEQLAARVPAADVTDTDIDREVQAVRDAARPA